MPECRCRPSCRVHRMHSVVGTSSFLQNNIPRQLHLPGELPRRRSIGTRHYRSKCDHEVFTLLQPSQHIELPRTELRLPPSPPPHPPPRWNTGSARLRNSNNELHFVIPNVLRRNVNGLKARLPVLRTRLRSGVMDILALRGTRVLNDEGHFAGYVGYHCQPQQLDGRCRAPLYVQKSIYLAVVNLDMFSTDAVVYAFVTVRVQNFHAAVVWFTSHLE